MPDSEHVPNKPGKKNWVEKTGGLPEYINRIAKDLMDKGMTESHAIATAVNTVKKWARGGGGVTPKTRAKAAAALAEWESKKAASHVGLSTPTRLERTRHARLRTMDLAAVLDRASSIADPETRDRTTYRLLDLAGTQALTPKSYNIDRVRDAYNGIQSKKRQAFYARQAKQRQAAGTLGSPIIDSPSSGPAYRYVKEVWNTHLIVKDDSNGLFKVPYTVGNSGADISFGNEVPVTEQYVELSDPADGWLADLDDRGNVTALAGEVFDLAFGQAESSGTATTSAALKTAYTARDAKAAKAVARKRAAGSRKTKRRARKGSTLHATQVRVGAKMRAMAAAEAHPGQPASKAIRDAVKVHQAQERVQARTEATGSGTGGAKWAHGWVPLNDAAKKQVAANPEKFKQMRKKQKKQAKSVSLSAALERAALIEDPAAKVAARLAILDLAKPGQRYRHGWIRIDGVPVGKSRPKVAGSRGLKVDGLTKEQHSARVDRIAAIPRTERTRKQQDQFVRSNAVLRGEAVPARSSAPVGEAAKASQAATSAGIEARKARKGLPAGQTSGSTGGMTNDKRAANHELNASIASVAESMHTGSKNDQALAARRFDSLHTQRGMDLWPDLSAEAARHRSVQDHQYRTGAITVGPNWERPSWYTGPAPKVSGPQGTQNRPAAKTKAERQAAINANRAQDARETNLRTGASPAKASGPISMRQAKAELNTKDRKAADRLISEMPKMETAHLQIAADSPSTSQKVKDAAHAELQKRYKENLHPGDSALKGTADAMKANPPGSRADTLSSGGANVASNLQTVPMSELSRLFNSSDPKVKEAARVEAVRRKNASMGRAADGVTPLSSQSARAAELRQGSTGRHPNADAPSSTPPPPFDRMTFKGHGIKHGDQIEAVKYDHQTKGPRVIRGTAHVKGSTIGVQEGDTLHDLGGTATKVMARKVAAGNVPGTPERAARDAASGAHPEKFKPGERPAVHKFLNTERLQQIAASTSTDPEAQANAAKAKEILQKRLGSKTSRPNARDLGLSPQPLHGTQSTNDAARGMTERILASRAANAPQVMNPRTPTGTAVVKKNGALVLTGPDAEVPVPKDAQKSTEALQLWTNQNLHRVDVEGAKARARQSRDTSSADITAARAARGQADTPTDSAAMGRISTQSLDKIYEDTSRSPQARNAAAAELKKRGRQRAPIPSDQPVRGGSVPPPRPIGGARGMGSAQTGTSRGRSGLETAPVPTTSTGKMGLLRNIVNDKSAKEVGGVVVDMNSANIAHQVINALSPANKEKILALPFHQMVERAMAIYARTQR